MLKRIQAGVLKVAYFDNGSSDGTPVFLLHGFPYEQRISLDARDFKKIKRYYRNVEKTAAVTGVLTGI